MDIEVRPAWADVERLFGPRGGAAGCWCMFWRQTNKEAAAGGPEERRDELRALVEAGEPVGLLAFADGEPVGWCAVAPRPAYRRIPRTKALAPADPDDPAVWAITCFLVRRDRRRQGVAGALLDAAVEHARAHGAREVESYPVVEATGGAGRLYGGTIGMFASAGFEPAARSAGAATGRKVVMRRPV